MNLFYSLDVNFNNSFTFKDLSTTKYISFKPWVRAIRSPGREAVFFIMCYAGVVFGRKKTCQRYKRKNREVTNIDIWP